MVNQQFILATLTTIVLVSLVTSHIKLANLKSCFSLWFHREYWVNYNIVEFAAYSAKLLIIIPGLVFHVQIWQLYFLTLLTSLLLMWASQQKLLPSLVYFNTVWVWLSCMVIAQSLV